jgi:hypothetical protein
MFLGTFFYHIPKEKIRHVDILHEDVKSVLIDRQTLKYKGGRVCPLPPPSAKPLYGGRAFKRKIKIAEESALL